MDVYNTHMNSRDVTSLLKKEGWILKRITGSHHHFIHPQRSGLVTVPHTKRGLPQVTLASIEKQARIKIREKKS